MYAIRSYYVLLVWLDHPGVPNESLIKYRITSYNVCYTKLLRMLGGLGLRMLLKPLKRVELQAEAICRREYHIQEKLPKTRELRQVVESMNRMTNQVREMFADQSKIAENLRRKAYSDRNNFV